MGIACRRTSQGQNLLSQQKGNREQAIANKKSKESYML